MNLKLKNWTAPLFYSVLAFTLSTFLLRFNDYITDDSVSYIRMGLNFFKGEGIRINAGEPYPFYPAYPPFYPIMIGLVNLFLKNPEFSGQFISMVAFSLTIIPLFFLSEAVYSRTAAHWVSLLFSTHGFLLIYSNLILTEPLFTFLLLNELFLMHETLQDKIGNPALGLLLGAVSGFAYLTRPEGLLFYAAGTLVTFFLSSKPFTFKVPFHLFSLFAFLALMFPYHHFLHKNIKSLSSMQFSAGIAPELIRRQLDLSNPGRYLEVKKIDWGISSDKKRFRIEELAEKFDFLATLRADHFALLRSIFPTLMWRLLELNRYLFCGLGFFFIGASFFGVPWNGPRKKSELLLLSFLLPFFCHLIIFFVSRRLLFTFPLFLLWMGQGIECFRLWTRNTFRLNPRKSVTAVSVIFLFFGFSSAWYLHKNLSQPDFPREHKEMGLWMKEHIPRIREKKVASGRPFIGYYSEAKFIDLPYVEHFEDLLAFLQYQKTGFFVVGEDLDRPLWDAYQFLLDEKEPPPPGIVRKYVQEGRKKLILYEILHPWVAPR